MDTLVRNTALGLSRRVNSYEPLDQSVDQTSRDDPKWSAFSRPGSRRRQIQMHMMHTFSVRRDRARKRRVFLQTYKLSSLDSSRKSTTSTRKLKTMAKKVKSLVVSFVSFVQTKTFRLCQSPPAAFASSSPTRVARCC